jgi:hypothetical protein
MKPVHRIIAIVTLGCAALSAQASGQTEDTATCRGGYRMQLMSPAECQNYLKQLKEVRTRSDRMAELELQEWHTTLLIQRAESCLCQEGTPVVLSQRRTGL